jgi:hypothetical protein
MRATAPRGGMRCANAKFASAMQRQPAATGIMAAYPRRTGARSEPITRRLPSDPGSSQPRRRRTLRQRPRRHPGVSCPSPSPSPSCSCQHPLRLRQKVDFARPNTEPHHGPAGKLRLLHPAVPSMIHLTRRSVASPAYSCSVIDLYSLAMHAAACPRLSATKGEPASESQQLALAAPGVWRPAQIISTTDSEIVLATPPSGTGTGTGGRIKIGAG